MEIVGLPFRDSRLYYIPTIIKTPFCMPKLIPLIVDTAATATTIGPKDAYELGITATMLTQLKSEKSVSITTIEEFAISPAELEFTTSVNEKHMEKPEFIHISIPSNLSRAPSLLGMDILQFYKISFQNNRVILEHI
jgi:hypothetical protein